MIAPSWALLYDKQSRVFCFNMDDTVSVAVEEGSTVLDTPVNNFQNLKFGIGRITSHLSLSEWSED